MRRAARWRNTAAALVVGCVLTTLQAAEAQAATSVGTSYATVALSGSVELSPQASLRLPLGTVTFDLRPGADPRSTPSCIIGTTSGDISTGAALGGGPVLPSGVSFRVGVFPAVEAAGGQPVAIDELPLGERTVLCYRSFVMGAFSNAPGWQLTVDRPAAPTDPAIENLYVGAACPTESGVGMYRMDIDQEATLVTSHTPWSCQEILLVMAVKPNQEASGTTTANVRYTLVSLSGEFESR